MLSPFSQRVPKSPLDQSVWMPAEMIASTTPWHLPSGACVMRSLPAQSGVQHYLHPR